MEIVTCISISWEHKGHCRHRKKIAVRFPTVILDRSVTRVTARRFEPLVLLLLRTATTSCSSNDERVGGMFKGLLLNIFPMVAVAETPKNDALGLLRVVSTTEFPSTSFLLNNCDRWNNTNCDETFAALFS